MLLKKKVQLSKLSAIYNFPIELEKKSRKIGILTLSICTI